MQVTPKPKNAKQISQLFNNGTGFYAYTNGKRVNSSIITTKYLFFETDESGPLKSMLIRSKGCVALIRVRLSFGFKNEAFTSQQSLQA